MDKLDTNTGFNGRIFLTEIEWETYLKRMPVRYIKKKKVELCEICGKSGDKENPIQNAHIIGFGLGITYLGLTPEYVDNDANIISAHRKSCNNNAELNIKDACIELQKRGVELLPSYLPNFIQQTWSDVKIT